VIESDTPNPVAIHCKNMTKTFGAGATQVAALRGIDLQVHYGEMFMIMGPSGCGKTTLVSIVAAILDQDAGQCQVLGREPKTMNKTERVRFRGRSIGFVFQMFNLLPALTAQENVSIPLLLNGFPRQSANTKAAEVLDLVGLGQRRHALPAQLSGGQQQRVAIARALIHDPKLIICDEPTSSLDHKAGHEVMGLLRRVTQDSGRALIVVTHDNRILEFADRIASMDDGKIIGIISTEGKKEK
jgi:putative ABC transport system ATP-binding protein